jgi:hypothetical protein
MGIQACFIAVLLGFSSGEAGESPGTPAGTLVAADPALENVGQLAVVLAIGDAGQVEPGIDAARLRGEVVKKLSAAGIRLVENEAALDPRLILHLESTTVPGVDVCVCRVQAALDRVVTIPGRKLVQVRAQVWRARPGRETVARAEAGKVIAAAALAQVEAFVAACRAARGPVRPALPDQPQAPAPESSLGEQPRVEGLGVVPGDVCVASKGGSVFHRPTCRLARRIAAGNLIRYRSRQEALQAGLRPCKSCEP